MSTDKPNLPSKDPQDGFDFIEYPCLYDFKAMCKVSPGVNEDTLRREIKKLIDDTIGEGSSGNVESKKSRTGKYISLTLSVSLESRQQLELVYKTISSAPQVVMTL